MLVTEARDRAEKVALANANNLEPGADEYIRGELLHLVEKNPNISRTQLNRAAIIARAQWRRFMNVVRSGRAIPNIAKEEYNHAGNSIR